jgi:hypothetical protein
MTALEGQFDVLCDVAQAFRTVGIPFWLRGGWALDFLMGELRTGHADIDVVAWRRDRDVICDTLAQHHFELDNELPEVAIDFTKSGHWVQVLLMEVSATGALVCHGFESWPFPEGSLDGPDRTLNGLTCHTLAAHALLDEKESYEAMRGRPLREKDRISIRLLRRLMKAGADELP